MDLCAAEATLSAFQWDKFAQSSHLHWRCKSAACVFYCLQLGALDNTFPMECAYGSRNLFLKIAPTSDKTRKSSTKAPKLIAFSPLKFKFRWLSCLAIENENSLRLMMQWSFIYWPKCVSFLHTSAGLWYFGLFLIGRLTFLSTLIDDLCGMFFKLCNWEIIAAIFYRTKSKPRLLFQSTCFVRVVGALEIFASVGERFVRSGISRARAAILSWRNAPCAATNSQVSFL